MVKGKTDQYKQDTNERWNRHKTRELFLEYVSSRDEHIREELVLHYMNLVRYLASRFANRGESIEDLTQVGCIGLIKAIDRFDPSKEVEFTTYATPTIVGEIKRYFRDKGWALKVPRRLQELNLAVNKASDQLSGSLNRSPTIAEIAVHLGVSEEDVLEAQELGQSYTPLSLDIELDAEDDKKTLNLLGYLGQMDLEMENIDDKVSLERAFSRLDKREQLVLYFRFYENMSQNEIAKHLKILQMHVSRLQHRAVDKLRKFLAEGVSNSSN